MTTTQSRWQHPHMLAFSLALVLSLPTLFIGAALMTRQAPLAFLAVPSGVMLAWWMLRLRGERWADVGLRRVTSWPRLLLVVGLGTLLLLILTNVLVTVLAASTGLKPDLSDFDQLRGNTAVLIVGLLLVWTTAAFGEELLFRGFIMHTLQRLSKPRCGEVAAWLWAILVTALFFGAGHAYQGLAGGILTGLIGIGFTATFFAMRRNLWGAILTHGVYDSVGFVAVYLSLDQKVNPSLLPGCA